MPAPCPLFSGLVAAVALRHASAGGPCHADATCSGPEDLSGFLQIGAPGAVPASELETKAGRRTLVDSEASAMSAIMTGGTSKSAVEIVLAHYHEDTEWSDAYEGVRTVYCKGPKARRPRGCHHLENVGREGHTYLYHIVHNYDRLSDWTVFTQAQAPTQGYRGHRRGGGHMLPGVPFDAYVLPDEAGGLPRSDGAAFVMTGALHMPTLNHSLRLSFRTATSTPTLHQQSTCPRSELLDGWERWWDLGWFKKYIGDKCKIKPQAVPKAFADYWDTYIKLPRPEHDIIFFSQGARFAASRERIRQRPKEFYEALLEKLSHAKDPCHNYFNEWIWYYIIGKPSSSPCDPALVLEEASKDKSWKGAQTLLEGIRAKRQKDIEELDDAAERSSEEDELDEMGWENIE